MSERQVRDRLAAAIGEPPNAEAAVRRLEAHLEAAAERPAQCDRPRGMALLAGALALLLVGGLLATQAARRSAELARSPAGGGGPAPAVTTPTPAGCRIGAPAQLVVIDLARQQLTAYDHGCPFLSTPVTTGSPRVRTEPGTFHVRFTSAAFTLNSPWPPGNPLWYPATTVHDYIAYSDAGAALHSAEWEPAAEFGPASEDGAYASHGTVHVPLAALQRLYGWVRVGATVTVVAGG